MNQNPAIYESEPKLALKSVCYLLVSTAITWWFIKVAPFYISEQQMLFSYAVAGGKWGFQIVLGYLILKTKRWYFIKEAAFVCFIGSVILLPYCFGLSQFSLSSQTIFILYLIVSVLTMMVLYFNMVKKIGIGLKWFALWLFMLFIAVMLQLTVVF